MLKKPIGFEQARVLQGPRVDGIEPKAEAPRALSRSDLLLPFRLSFLETFFDEQRPQRPELAAPNADLVRGMLSDDVPHASTLKRMPQ